jgi:integrase
MSETHSTTPAVPNKPKKPAKPYAEYPLTVHPAGYWCKKIRGRLHYFGPRFNPANVAAAMAAADAALADYNRQADALHAGREPRPDMEALTVKEVVNAFLNAKREAVEAGELSPRTHTGYRQACDEIVSCYGKARLVSDLGPDDFAKLRNKLAKKYGPHRLGTTMQCVRCAFKFAFDAGLTDRPPRYGPGFKKPTKKTLRLHKAQQGAKLFTKEEIHTLLAAASVHLRAMFLLAVNAGYGNADVGNLPLSALDLEGGWADYPRPKTGIPRRCPLWPETVEAIKESLARRPEPKNPADAGLVFLTKKRGCWAKDTNASPLSAETHKLMNRLGINGRKGLGFYTLRHVFITVADEAKDQPAADCIMGHEVPHMSSVYRETISDERLKAVAEHVRRWLFAELEPNAATPGEGEPRILKIETAG